MRPFWSYLYQMRRRPSLSRTFSTQIWLPLSSRECVRSEASRGPSCGSPPCCAERLAFPSESLLLFMAVTGEASPAAQLCGKPLVAEPPFLLTCSTVFAIFVGRGRGLRTGLGFGGAGLGRSSKGDHMFRARLTEPSERSR